MSNLKDIEQVLAVFIFPKRDPDRATIMDALYDKNRGDIFTSVGLIGRGFDLQRDYQSQKESVRKDVETFYSFANHFPAAYYVARWVNSRGGVPIHAIHEFYGLIKRPEYCTNTVRVLSLRKVLTTWLY